MMNALALCLVISSLAAAGLFSQQPEQKQRPPKEQQQHHERERITVIEYVKEVPGDTQHAKSSTPPSPETYGLHDKSDRSMASGVFEDAKDKFEQAGSVLPNLGQGVSETSEKNADYEHRQQPRELICDALGKCKHRIAEVLGKAKERVEAAGECVEGVVGDVKEKVFEKSHEIGEEIKEAGEATKEKTEQVWGKAKDEVKEAGESVVEKTKGAMGNVKERVIEKEDEFEQGVKEAGQMTKKKTLDVMEDLKKGRTALCDQRSIKTKAMGLFHEGERNLTHLIRSGGKQAYNAIRQTVGSESANLAMAVVQLIGFGIAFGASVWITFVSSFVLSAVLPKGLFGVVQSKMYPMYFKILIASIVCTLISHVRRCLTLRSGEGGSAAKYQVWNLLGAIVMVLLNLYWLEPRASKVMFERMKLEKEEGNGVGIPSVQEEVVEPSIPTISPCGIAAFGPSTTEGGGAGATAEPVERSDPGEQEEVQTKLRVLSRRLKKLNTFSSNLNMTTIMCLSWHLIYLAQHLQVA